MKDNQILSPDLPPIQKNLSKPVSTKIIHRPIHSRSNKNNIKIIKSLRPGKITDGCIVCCTAPSCCQGLTICPCCGDSEEIRLKRESSSYIYLRENSIEWNHPKLILSSGSCIGVDPCLFDIQDNITTLYYDDIRFQNIHDNTRFCNEFLTCLIGGYGESIIISPATHCFCFERGYFPCPLIPTCIPSSICPCSMKKELYLHDAQNGIGLIKSELERIKNSEYYNDN